MGDSSIFLTAIAAVFCTAVLGQPNALNQNQDVAEELSGAYIVKLQAGVAKTEADIESYILNNLSAPDVDTDDDNAASEGWIDSHGHLRPMNPPTPKHGQVYRKIPASKIRFRQIINTPLYQGASVEIIGYSPVQIRSALHRLPHVTSPPKPVWRLPTSPWQDDHRPPKVGIGKKFPVPPEFSAQSWHIQTGVDELHRRGIYGKGVKIGVLDSGIFYDHPALGGGEGPGKKVASVKKFSDAVNTTSEDCEGHGTHVAGIIAGNAIGITDSYWRPDFDWWGVAPQATLSSYQLGCSGLGGDDTIVAVICAAQADGQHILSDSWGRVNPVIGGAVYEAVEAVSKAGMIVVFAAGNDGGSYDR
ncbi:hypothetical protein HDV00_011001 [Rhizophlyctis rosea]|nr:hypothetical protein HDV00_011001 [Rhizophlyctis rosea]